MKCVHLSKGRILAAWHVHVIYDKDSEYLRLCKCFRDSKWPELLICWKIYKQETIFKCLKYFHFSFVLHFVVVSKSRELYFSRKDFKRTFYLSCLSQLQLHWNPRIFCRFFQIKTICIKITNVNLHTHFNVYVNNFENLFLFCGYLAPHW